MDNDLKHLELLLKAATSWTLFNKNPILYKVALNDYRYYKEKFKQKHRKSPDLIENVGSFELWKEVKHPYDGKVKYGFDLKVRNNWYNFSWNV